jgi:hypothetical protein
VLVMFWCFMMIALFPLKRLITNLIGNSGEAVGRDRPIT